MAGQIILIDEQPVILHGLAAALQPHRFRLLAADPENGLAAIRDRRSRLVLIEARFATGDGLGLLEEALPDGPPVAVYSEFDNPTFIARAVALGAVDYLLKQQPLSQVVTRIRHCAAGRPAPTDSLFGQMQAKLREVPTPVDSLPEMTSREYQVFRHLGMGLSNREIGQSLGISVETVKEHVQNILRKLDVNDRTHAAVTAIRAKIA